MAESVTAPARKRAPRKPPTKPPKVEVEVFDPAYDAHRLRLAGMPWVDVAARLGYPSPNAARMGVQIYLSKAAAELDKEQKTERLQLQLDRYDEVLRAFWDSMRLGDEKAAAVVLGTLRQIDKLLRLDQPDQETGVTKTIVVAGTEQEYLAGLRAYAAGAG